MCEKMLRMLMISLWKKLLPEPSPPIGLDEGLNVGQGETNE
jgi:hypothetical protein